MMNRLLSTGSLSLLLVFTGQLLACSEEQAANDDPSSPEAEQQRCERACDRITTCTPVDMPTCVSRCGAFTSTQLQCIGASTSCQAADACLVTTEPEPDVPPDTTPDADPDPDPALDLALCFPSSFNCTPQDAYCLRDNSGGYRGCLAFPDECQDCACLRAALTADTTPCGAGSVSCQDMTVFDDGVAKSVVVLTCDP